MRAMPIGALLFVGVLAVVAANTACKRRVPYVLCSGGPVTAEVIKAESGHITDLMVRVRLGTNVYQELYIFDATRRLDDKQAVQWLYRPRVNFAELRDHWIGCNDKWNTLIRRIQHPAGGTYYLVMQNPPTPGQVGGMDSVCSVLTTNPSVVLHEQAVRSLHDAGWTPPIREAGADAGE